MTTTSTARMTALLATLAFGSPAFAQSSLPAAPAPSLPATGSTMPALPPPVTGPAPVDRTETVPSAPPIAAGNPTPACTEKMITDRVFDFSSKQVKDHYDRTLYGQVMKVTQLEDLGTFRRCSGEMSDSDGWIYDVRYVVEKKDDTITIGYDFSHTKKPPRAGQVLQPDATSKAAAVPTAPVFTTPSPNASPALLPPAPTVKSP